MINNSLTWFSIVIVFTIISLIINMLFKQKTKGLQSQIDEQEQIKSVKYKSIDEQKTYLQNKTDLGKDFIYMVLSIMIFFIGFRILIYPLINNILIGILSSVLFGGLFGFFMAEYVYPKKYFYKNFVNNSLNVSFIGLFMVYMKFLDVLHPLLMISGTIIIMIGIGWLWKKVKL